MSASSATTGFIAAVVLHLVLFVPWWPEASTPVGPDSAPKPALAVKVNVSPPAEEPETPMAQERPVAETPQSPPPAPEPVEAAPSALALSEVAEAPTAEVEHQGGDLASQRDGAGLPPLQIRWRNPDEVLAVSQALGLRVLALGREEETLGEIVGTRSGVQLVAFVGDYSRFSNRVRTLPGHFFGKELKRTDAGLVALYMILVPAEVDEHLMAAQRAAIKQVGLQPEEVAAVEARFRLRGESYELEITSIERA
jgi:hypothetical protein